MICTDHRTSTKPVVSTTQQSVTLTTILLPPSIKPDYEKLPTLEPVNDTKEKEKPTTIAAAATTTSTVASPVMDTTSSTIFYNKTSSVQPSPIGTTMATEATDKPTTINNRIGKKIVFTHSYHFIHSLVFLLDLSHFSMNNINFVQSKRVFLYTNTESTTSEAFTVVDIASSSVPLTTFETYDVENTTAENVTLEFVDLPTTEAISSTSSISQYLETANYKQGTHF